MEGTSGPYPESHWGQVASRNWWEASFASVREYADILPEIPKRAGSEPGLCVPSHSWMLTFSDPNMRSQTVISSQQEVRYHRIPHVQGWEVSKRKPRNNEHFQQGATHHSKLTLPHSLSMSMDIDIKHKPPVYSIWEFLFAAILISKMIYSKESTPPRCKIHRKNTNTSASCLWDINGTGKTSSQLQPCNELWTHMEKQTHHVANAGRQSWPQKALQRKLSWLIRNREAAGSSQRPEDTRMVWITQATVQSHRLPKANPDLEHNP